MGVLIITHYQRILHMVKPQFVHIMFEGRIVKEGGPELVDAAREARLRLDRARRSRGRGMSLAVPPGDRVPGPRAGGPGLPRLGRDVADAAAGDRGDGPATTTSTAASIHRGVYPLAVEATEAYEGAREKVAAFAGSTAGETIFTRNGDRGDQPRRVLVGPREHRARRPRGAHADGAPLEHRAVADWLGAELAWVPVDDDGLLDLDALDAALARGPKLVAVAHVSNVLGTVNPIAEITAPRARRRARSWSSTACRPCRTCRSTSARSTPTSTPGPATRPTGRPGIGVLHGRRALLEAMPPFLGGGHMIARVTEDGSTSAEPPAKFEAGTMPVAEAIGLGAAVDFLSEHRHGRGLGALARRRRLRGRAAARGPGLTLYGPSDIEHRGSVASFALEGVHPHDVAEILGREGVCVRAGHHCAQPLMRRLGVSATTRASFAVHSTREEVDRLIDGLGTVREVFSR